MKNINMPKKTVLLLILILSVGSICDIQAQNNGQFLKEKYNEGDTTYEKIIYEGFTFMPEGYGVFVDREERKYIKEKTIIEFYYKEGKIIISSNSDLISNKVLYVKQTTRTVSSISSPLLICLDEKGKEFLILISGDDYNYEHQCSSISVTEVVTKTKRKHYIPDKCATLKRR